MPLIRHAARLGSAMLGQWAAPASSAANEFVRHMGTERRPGESGAWKASEYDWGALMVLPHSMAALI